MPPAMKLLIGVGVTAFMKYGLLQEAVFKYRAADGGQFTQVWFLMVLESFANVLVGSAGMQITGGTKTSRRGSSPEWCHAGNAKGVHEPRPGTVLASRSSRSPSLARWFP